MNKGLSTSGDLVKAFPHVKSQSIVKKTHANQIPNPYWLSGFVSGEGSFQVDIKKNSNLKLGFQVLLRFSIGQQARDEQLLRNIISYLDCGIVQKKNN